MARRGFVAEKLLDIVGENGAPGSGVQILFGAAAPGGDTGEQDDAPIGSLYARTNGVLYTKIADTDAASDWEIKGDVSLTDLRWRNEKVIAATNDTLSAGSGIDPTAWSDNEQGLDGDDIPNGTYVIGDVDGVPTLFEKTAQASPTSITLAAVSQAIADGDTFVVQNYLPDSPAAQEAQAIIHFPTAGSPGVKISDFNWALADGINTTGSWTPTAGAPSAGETLEDVTEKTEKGVADLVTLSGVARNALNLGAWTAPVTLLFSATSTVKALFQRIGELLAQLRGVQVTGITAATTVDSVVVDDVSAVKWLVTSFEEATPGNRTSREIYAMHNGTASADATATDETVYAKLKTGSNFNLDFTVDLSGAGAAQVMRLRATSSTAGVTVTARRIEVRKNVL